MEEKVKVLFCQISDTLINKNSPKFVKENLDNIYNAHKEDGYYRNEHWLEIPLWIPRICYFLPDKRYIKSRINITHIEDSVNYIIDNNPNYVVFSVMNDNIKYIIDILNTKNQYPLNKTTFIVGGYSIIEDKHLLHLDTIEDVAKLFEEEYEYGLDYSLFNKEFTIPRLTLSTGCNNNCSFCTNIEQKVIPLPEVDIIRQERGFHNLNYKLIYIDDKNWGQCNNFGFLREIYNYIHYINDKFKGFIVQSSVDTILNLWTSDFTQNYIRIVEVGIESYNDSILKLMNKQQNILEIDECIRFLNIVGVKIIPNIIVGYPDETIETYNNTLEFLKENKDKFYHINIYNYSLYENTGDAKRLNIPIVEGDNCESNFNKSFYTEEQVRLNTWFYTQLVELNKQILKIS